MTERRYASKADRGWWYRATDEQRIAQIDAGIELGMTAKQIAMNCGCVLSVTKNGSGYDDRKAGGVIFGFASRNCRPLNINAAINTSKRKQMATISLKKAKAAIQGGVIVDAAFDIFGVSSPSEAFLDDTGA